MAKSSRGGKTDQLDLPFRGWGGARAGAGRKAKSARKRVSHKARPELSRHHPVHTTIQLQRGLPSLRCDSARRSLERAFAAGCDRSGFRLVHYSIQSNHLHLLVEARDRVALSRGMQGLLVRAARALNGLWSRQGPVFADHYHARVLRTSVEVRRALVYVLCNARKHRAGWAETDPCTSGASFDGWSRTLEHGIVPPRSTAASRTWLLSIGWRRRGRIDPDESPRS